MAESAVADRPSGGVGGLPNGEPIRRAEASRLSPYAEARETFKHEVRSSTPFVDQARDLKRVTKEYESVLSSAVRGKTLLPKGQHLPDVSAVTPEYLTELSLRLRETHGGVYSLLHDHIFDPQLESVDIAKIDASLADIAGQELQGISDENRTRLQRERHSLETLKQRRLKQDENLRRLPLLIGQNIYDWESAERGMNPQRGENAAILQMAQFLAENSRYYHSIREQVSIGENLWRDIAATAIRAEAAQEISELNPDVLSFAVKRWIGETRRAANVGETIYETPFYKDLLEEINFLRWKKNGLGGVLLYGPPGTGKTELLQKKNAQQGYKTRVVSIHHYTSFAELVAEKGIKVGDPGAALSQKLDAIVKAFETGQTDVFESASRDLFQRLQREHRIPEDVTLGQFLASHLASSDIIDFDSTKPEEGQQGINEMIARSDFTDQEWEKIKQSFIKRQRARMLQTALPVEFQEGEGNILYGEIIQAIKNRERVVLDEIDKAGPNALGGILGLLARPPGKDITFGTETIAIPSWFRIDATCNDISKLSDPMKDRFSPVEVGTPPPKDQLMIAAVRLSDKNGNIRLSSYEQRQLVGFYLYVVPEINGELSRYGVPPLSIRSVNELTGKLVEFDTLRRTEKSFSEAVKELLKGIKLRTQNEKAATAIDTVMKKFKSTILIDNAQDDVYDLDAAPTEQSLDATTLDEKYAMELQETVESPLTAAIVGLPDAKKPRSVFVAGFTADQKQQEAIYKHLQHQREEEEANREQGDVRNLPTSLTVYTEPSSDGKTIVTIGGFSTGETEPHILAKGVASTTGRILTTSPDGKSVSFIFDSYNNTHAVAVTSPFSEGSQAAPQIESLAQKSKIITDKANNHLASIAPDGTLTIYNLQGQKVEASEEIVSVADCSFSGDGSMIIINKTDGSTLLRSADVAEQPVVKTFPRHEDGYVWRFTGDREIVQVGTDGSVLPRLVVAADTLWKLE